jgi:hypothetical protein
MVAESNGALVAGVSVLAAVLSAAGAAAASFFSASLQVH